MIKYSYEGPEDSRNRPFCAKLLKLNRLYSRQDIESISAKLGYSVFDRRGGWWRHKDGTTTPYCRHSWKSNVVVAKTAVEPANLPTVGPLLPDAPEAPAEPTAPAAPKAPKAPKVEAYLKPYQKLNNKKDIHKDILSRFNSTGLKAASTITEADSHSLAELQAKHEQFASLLSDYKLTGWDKKMSFNVNLQFNSSKETFGQITHRTQLVGKNKYAKLESVNFGSRYANRTATRDLTMGKSAVDANNKAIATLTHEFAHVISIGAHKEVGLADHAAFWDKMLSLRTSYMSELSKTRNKDIFLGRYASTNANEFMAEAFTEYKLHSQPSKYAKLVGALIDEYFKR